jgi:hypothetical protein
MHTHTHRVFQAESAILRGECAHIKLDLLGENRKLRSARVMEVRGSIKGFDGYHQFLDANVAIPQIRP